MGVCRVGANEYDETFTIRMRGETYEFDCFEYAIQDLALLCANCAEHAGVLGMRDRA